MSYCLLIISEINIPVVDGFNYINWLAMISVRRRTIDVVKEWFAFDGGSGGVRVIFVNAVIGELRGVSSLGTVKLILRVK